MSAFAWPVITKADALTVLQSFLKKHPRDKGLRALLVPEIERLKRELKK
ncbi:MAG: hypothetical protein V4527_18310 [Pseudomonadota bacterium]